jgi:hypothetical protein
MKNKVLLLLGFILFSCSINKNAAIIAENFCNCNDSIMKSDEDLNIKRVKLEDCHFNLSRDIDRISKDSISKVRLSSTVTKLIESSCSEYYIIGNLYNQKRSIATDLEKNSFRCREFFIDGEYVPVGVNVPLRVIRKGAENIVKYLDYGCESIFEVKWIDDCEYYLIQKSTSCFDQEILNGDSLLVRIIEIKNDTVHYEIDKDSNTYPQILKRVNN